MTKVRHKYINILFFFLITFSGCQKEQVYLPIISHSFMDVRITANPLVLPESDKNGRFYQIPDENTIREILIIVFDENNKYLGIFPVINNRVSVPHTPYKRSLYVVANANKLISESSEFWTPGETTETIVSETLIQIITSDKIHEMPFVMSARLILEQGINSNSAISNDGTKTGSALLLKRNVAKISVNSSVAISESFVIQKLMLCNAPDKGYLLRYSPVSSASAINYTLSENNTPLYSFASDDKISIIIQATTLMNGIPAEAPRFYKLTIKDPQSQKPVSLNPNNWYKITITSKSGDGHLSIEEAIASPASNEVTSMIEVRDITMNDHVFGRDNYISTSNTYYQQYGHHHNQKNYEVCKVRFGNNNGTNNESLNNISIEVIKGDIRIATSTNIKMENLKEDETYSILIEFTELITEAVVRIKYEHLIKDIYINSHASLDIKTDHFIALTKTICGKIINPDSHTAWCGINNEKIFTTNKFMDLNTTTDGTLFLCIKQDPNLNNTRELSAAFASIMTGMTHIYLCQNP